MPARKEIRTVDGAQCMRCSKCKKWLGLDRFNRNAPAATGYQSRCRECQNSDTAAWRIKKAKEDPGYQTRASATWRLNNPERAKAHRDYSVAKNMDGRRARSAISNSIASGYITRPDRCEVCGTGGGTVAHHDSYEAERWMTVVWVCTRCHGDRHRRHPLALDAYHREQDDGA
jgi:hypothetical protein